LLETFPPILLQRPVRALASIYLVLLAATLGFAQKSPKAANQRSFERFSTEQLRNADVVVRKLDIPAGESVSIGAATQDYVLVSFGLSTLAVSGYQTNFDLNTADEEVQVMQGGWPHKLENHSNTAAHLLLVEVARNLFPKSAICGLGAKNCHETKYGQAAEGEYRQTTLFETPTAKFFRVNLGAHVLMHQHNDGLPHLLIALSHVEGHADDDNFSLHRSETHFHLGSMEELGNDGIAEARLLILELREKY
jgi:hypothetical protein